MKVSKLFPVISYFYFIIPVLLFLTGWCNIFVAISGVIILGISTYYLCKNAPALWLPTNRKEVFLLVICVILALIWVYWAGIGALVFQNMDHECRNPIFELLVTQQWPVITTFGTGNGQYSYLLTYYIAFWLPPALVGKVFHSLQIGYYAQIAWATLGVFLTFYYALSFVKNKTLWAIIIFIFFSGLDVVGCMLAQNGLATDMLSHMEWWFGPAQFSSFTTQLFWVFNQALPAWLITLVILKEKNNRSILFLYPCLFIHSTLPALGLFPVILYTMYRNSGYMYKKLLFNLNKLKKSFLNMLTFQNIVGGGLIFVISFLYLTNNISGGNVAIGNSAQTSAMGFLVGVLLLTIFIPLEVGIYLALVWKNYRYNILFYLLLLMFLVYPFIRVGSGYDFCMRATIPALIILYIFIIKVFENTDFMKDKFRIYALIFALALGSITSMHEMERTVYCTCWGLTKAKSNLSISNFFAYADNNKFLKYAGKKNQ